MTFLQDLTASLSRLTGERRATIDTPTAAPSPLRPIDLTDDASVAEVLDLAVRVGEVLLASGTAAMDTATQVQYIAATYGLARCDVDVTYNSITLSAHRGPTRPPASTMRIVHYRSMDFTRLAEVDRLIRAVRVKMVPPSAALERLDEITKAPHPYNRWIATLAWSGMAAAISVLLGGGALVAVVSFLTTMVIDRIGRVLNRAGLPFFFQQVVGGFVAATPAITLYNFQDQLNISISPSQIIAAGVIVLLSGLSLVGSVQDAITGAPITAVSRFFEVLMMTGGIIAGVATSLRLAALIGSDLPQISNLAPPDILQVPTKVIAGAAASLFYALACYAERRALTAAFMGGFAGSLVYLLSQTLNVGPIIASAIAATVVGFAGGLLARRALIPPLIVAVAGITPLLPGLALYRGLYAILNDQLLLGISSLFAAFGVGCGLAAGVTLGEWGARTLRRPRTIARTEELLRPTLRRTEEPRRPTVRRRRGTSPS
ncbi:threonine/serine exporter family protein [Rhodococcus sp. IEGM 1401]|uniref:threonine/serine ThrE exporter family protein n=1 Tax=unclassified Rhodococcus (in: high G+C Gram-positive bacteria) TaxID=192944 RepID=UPI0022B5830C|nr:MULTISPECIES: threonine/serine exporter family protein [unclassified Rhodococcus (in: high G+C Gram-positive bacteria)]MCZ4563964.1 threonine/serine exporter family protein [Rhodococcus sp. IEGM 1401]MDI9924118.1 threonine/serine exporter family protein [Rhodococcus sp. IEGM 1372]MDV8036566.1 threonine/serine exporter family protein [Rhodococcus sp. IEGM 1414]